MTPLQTSAIVLTGAALASYANQRFLKLPATMGMMVFALLLSLVGLGLSHLGFVDLRDTSAFVRTIDFSSILLHGMLSLMLFAGALQIDFAELQKVRTVVSLLATVGVALSAFVTGSLVWMSAHLIGLQLSYVYCLVFGALIAPTDPIAVMSILKTVKAPKRFCAKIGGESLLNDGVGVVLFLTLLGIATTVREVVVADVLATFIQHMLGGIALGVLLGWLLFRLLNTIDDYKVEVMLTLALATGSYALAETLEMSAPITVAIAGLAIGYQGRSGKLPLAKRHYLNLFWELLDEVLNAVLFLLIGLVLIIIPMTWELLVIDALAIASVLIARFTSVGIPVGIIRLIRPVNAGTIRLLTWGGLRGGISIALALSVPAGPEKDILLSMTYCVVVFSVLVQGLTFKRSAEVLLDQVRK